MIRYEERKKERKKKKKERKKERYKKFKKINSMDSIDCMASIDCYSFSEHILVYVFVSLIGVYMSRGGPTRTAYSIFIIFLVYFNYN